MYSSMHPPKTELFLSPHRDDEKWNREGSLSVRMGGMALMRTKEDRYKCWRNPFLRQRYLRYREYS